MSAPETVRDAEQQSDAVCDGDSSKIRRQFFDRDESGCPIEEKMNIDINDVKRVYLT